jgi:hypothetical protein
MNAPKMCMLPCWLSSDGEEYVGNQKYFEDQQDQQECANQGKYSMGLLWCPIHFNHLLILHVSNFDNPKDILAIWWHVTLTPTG